VEPQRDGREIAVIVRCRGNRAAFVVDEVQGEAQTVIKRPAVFLRGLPGISGTAVIGNGAVAMVLDTAAIFRELENDIAGVA
jgi:two-component system chemotaxis sensor kinase CheA